MLDVRITCVSKFMLIKPRQKKAKIDQVKEVIFLDAFLQETLSSKAHISRIGYKNLKIDQDNLQIKFFPKSSFPKSASRQFSDDNVLYGHHCNSVH